MSICRTVMYVPRLPSFRDDPRSWILLHKAMIRRFKRSVCNFEQYEGSKGRGTGTQNGATYSLSGGNSKNLGGHSNGSLDS
jgi:hypothetical protein